MSGDHGDSPSPQRQLYLWVHGHDTTSCFDFFSRSPHFELRDLHAALKRAVDDIYDRLDHQLELVIFYAKEDQHRIELDEADFFEGRVLNVYELVGMDDRLTSLNRARVVQLLDMCKDEIAWEENEIRRLEVHCEVAKEQRSLGHRQSFRYRPLPRRNKVIVPGVGAFDVDERRDSEGNPDATNVEEDEDLMDMDNFDDKRAANKVLQGQAVVAPQKEDDKNAALKVKGEQEDTDMEDEFVRDEAT